jgi:protein-S-isoprenylcysteine O-methyltransferase Ste14
VTLAERLREDGRRLFASRAVIPLIILPLLVLALPESWRAEEALGERGSAIVEWLALAVAFAGLAVRTVTVAFAPEGTSSRDTRAFRAPSLNTTGMYSLVRHPLYLGSGLMWVGVVMSLRVWWFALLVALVYGLYVERLMLAEEAFIDGQFGEQFRRWAAQTPALVPRLSGWRPATGDIQWRRVLGEHNGLLGLSFAFLLLQVLEDELFESEPWPTWYADHSNLVLLLGISVAISLVSIVVRRRTEGPKPVTEAELL